MQRDPARYLWRMAKNRARKNGERFSITPEDVRAVWPRTGRCPALGIALSHGHGGMHDGSPTLDRLNAEWGYEPGNIAVLSLRANRAKCNLTARELGKIAAWMRAHGLN